LGDRPMRVAVPDAPCDRGVGTRQNGSFVPPKGSFLRQRASRALSLEASDVVGAASAFSLGKPALGRMSGFILLASPPLAPEARQFDRESGPDL
jgi:hypothetical protein